MDKFFKMIQSFVFIVSLGSMVGCIFTDNVDYATYFATIAILTKK